MSWEKILLFKNKLEFNEDFSDIFVQTPAFFSFCEEESGLLWFCWYLQVTFPLSWVRVSSFKPEAVVLNQDRVECPPMGLWGSLSQQGECKLLCIKRRQLRWSTWSGRPLNVWFWRFYLHLSHWEEALELISAFSFSSASCCSGYSFSSAFNLNSASVSSERIQ